MISKNSLHISQIGLAISLLLCLQSWIQADRTLTIAYLIAAAIWIVNIFLWDNHTKDDNESSKC